MPPRECDNDDCDYVSYVDDNGQPRVRWEHVAECTPMWGPEADNSSYRGW